MGYTTEFTGSVSIDPPLNEHEIAFLRDLSTTRRMHRKNGPLYVASTGNFGQNHDPDILNYNQPDPDQPGLWCQWAPTDDGTEIEWDGGEKFYMSAEWMKYLVTNLLAPSATNYVALHGGEDPRLQHFACDHVVDGTIYAQGEESEDRWAIVVDRNVVKVAATQIAYLEAQEV